MKLKTALKVLGVGLVGGVAAVSLAACSNSSKSSSSSKPTITMYTFTTQQPMINELKKLKYPATIKQVVIPYANFQTKLDKVLGTSSQPDIVALDAGFVEKYVDSGKLVNLDNYGAKTAEKNSSIYQYTIDMGKTSSGQQAALSYQAAPGCMYYNTTVFQNDLGIAPTDTTAAQAALSSWSQIEKTAATIKEKSGGKDYLFSSLQDIYMPVIGARTEGWVNSKNELTIDPTMISSLDVMKDFVQNGWTQNTVGQDSNWFAGMSTGNIGVYSLPSWGLFYWLQDYAKGTAGNWRVTAGPVNYSWGGTWFGAIQGSKNQDAAAKLAIYLATNKEYLAWDTKTNADFTSSKTVNDAAAKDSSSNVKLLGGQNPFPIFSAASTKINGKTATQYDQNIQTLWINDVINPYANGKTTEAAALKTFKADVKSAYPNIKVD